MIHHGLGQYSENSPHSSRPGVLLGRPHHIEQGGVYPDSSPRTRPLNNFNVTSGSFPSSTPFCPQWLSKHKQGLLLHIAYTPTRPACVPLPPSLLTSIQTGILTGSGGNCVCKGRSGTREGLC